MIDLFNFQNKFFLVTGASSGIGKECAIELSQLGANLIICGRDRDRLEQTKEQLKPGHHFIIAHDLLDLEEFLKQLETVLNETGSISGFVHSAALSAVVPLRNMSVDLYDEMFKINTISAFEITKIITKKRYLHPEGLSIVFISSIRSELSSPAMLAYSATKGALVSGMRSLALELVSKNVRVNAVSPGHIKTEMLQNYSQNLGSESMQKLEESYPLGFGEKMDVVYLVIFLLSKASKWFTGSNIVIDGGYSIQ